MGDSLVACPDGWLAGWLAGWLVGWLIGWLAGWLIGWLAASACLVALYNILCTCSLFLSASLSLRLVVSFCIIMHISICPSIHVHSVHVFLLFLYMHISVYLCTLCELIAPFVCTTHTPISLDLSLFMLFSLRFSVCLSLAWSVLRSDWTYRSGVRCPLGMSLSLLPYK